MVGIALESHSDGNRPGKSRRAFHDLKACQSGLDSLQVPGSICPGFFRIRQAGYMPTVCGVLNRNTRTPAARRPSLKAFAIDPHVFGLLGARDKEGDGVIGIQSAPGVSFVRLRHFLPEANAFFGGVTGKCGERGGKTDFPKCPEMQPPEKNKGGDKHERGVFYDSGNWFRIDVFFCAGHGKSFLRANRSIFVTLFCNFQKRKGSEHLPWF